jgi:tetratricopeptide (TPR) repeat protein
MTISQVKLTLTDENDDQELNRLTEHYRTEIIGTGWKQMGKLLWKLGHNDKAEEIYKMLLLEQVSDEMDEAYYYNELGNTKLNQGEYKEALDFYEKTVQIQEKALPPNHSHLAISYNNIGSVYRSMGEYSKALSSFERSLEIRKVALPPNHPDLAISYNNIGLAYDSMGEYSKALSNFQQALDIREQVLPPTHPDLIACKNSLEQVKQML